MAPERLARSGILSLLGSSFSAVAALALTVLVGHLVGAHGTGLFFQALGLFTIASQVLRLGTNSSIVKSISEQRAFGRAGEAWRTVLIAVVPVAAVSTVGSVLLWWQAGPLASWLASPGTESDLEGYLRLMAPAVLVGAVLAVLQIASRMVNGIGTYTVTQSVLQPSSRLVLVGAALLATGSAFAGFAAWLITVPIWLVATLLIIARPLITDWRRRSEAVVPFRPAAARFWRFGASRSVGGALEILLEWSDVLIVAALSTPAAAGVYAVATRAVRAGQVVDRAMRLAVSPRISALLARGERIRARDLHTRVTRAMILVSWPFYLTLGILSPSVLLLFGDQFAVGAPVLSILASAMLVASAAGMLQSILLQGGRSSWQVLNKAAILSISIGGNLALVPIWGLVGAAVIWAVCVLVETMVAGWQVHRRMRVALQPRLLIGAMALPLGVFGFGCAITRLWLPAGPLSLAMSLLVLGGSYVALLWLLRRRLGIEVVWLELSRPFHRRRSAPPDQPSSEPPQAAHSRAHW